MTRIATVVLALCVVHSTSTSAQEKKEPPPASPQTTERPAADGRGQPVNIRIDVSIVDEGVTPPSRKAVSLTLGDRQAGSVRAIVLAPGSPDVPLNVDAMPTVQADGRIHARITLDYRPNSASDSKMPVPPQMRVTFGLLLADGKKIVAAQAADPTTDRRVSVEVTATLLRP